MKGNARAVVLDVLITVATTLAAIGLTIWLWLNGAGTWFETPFLNVVAWMGALVSLAGVLLAYLIFRRQARQSTKSTSYSNQVLSDLQELLARVDGKVTDVMEQMSNRVPDAEAEAESNVRDLWADVTPQEAEGATYLVSPSGKRRRLYPPGSVPLAVVGALVSVWRADGRTGRWDLRTLRGAFRAEGKGNHPWFLVFVPPGQKEPVLWKVTRGPNDKDSAIEVKTTAQL